LNFPHTHPLYIGNHWSEGLHNSPLETADFVLVLDCDVPWVKMNFRPAPNAKVYHIDCDPVKVNMSLFHIDTDLSCQANVGVALQQLNAYLSPTLLTPLSTAISERSAHVKTLHETYISEMTIKEAMPSDNEDITPHYVLSVLRELIDEGDANNDSTIVLSEAISNYRPVADVLRRSAPGTFFTSGATSLGWHGGAAVGAKLACPSKTVVSITGDGSFLFSIPSTVHWMARRYDAPFLTVVLNNGGWKSPMLSAMAVDRDGWAAKTTPTRMGVGFEPEVDYSAVAVAAGAGWGAMVHKASEVQAALRKGLETVRAGRAAVVDVRLKRFEVGDRVG
jgi:acetolactate synthase-1/2/3 large subunit